MSNTPTPVPQQAAAGPLMLALTRQVELDGMMAGILYARLVRRGYRERADRALGEGNHQGNLDWMNAGSQQAARRLF